MRVGDGLEPQKFRPSASPDGAVATPQARPIDTFVNPASTLDRNAGSQLSQLATALSSIAPSLARFSAQRQQNQNTEQYKAGVEHAARMQAAGTKWKEFTDNGTVRESDNPFFVAGVKEQWGAAAAEDFMGGLATHLAAKPELQDSIDMKGYDAAISEFRDKWAAENMGDKDQYFKTGFAARAEAKIAEARRQLQNHVAGKIEEMSVATNFVDTKGVGRDLVTKMAPEQWVPEMNQRITDLRAQGRNPMMLAQSTAAAFVELAQEMSHDEGIEIAGAIRDLKIDGKPLLDYLSKDKELTAKVRDLGDVILSKEVQHTQLANAQQKAKDSDTIEEAQRGIALAFGDGDVQTAQDIIKQMAIDVPGSEQHLGATLDRLQATQDNPQRQIEVMHDIWRANSKVTIGAIFSDPSLGPGDVKSLVNQVQERDAKIERAEDREEARENRAEARADKASRKADRVFGDPQFRMELGNVDSSSAFAQTMEESMANMLEPSQIGTLKSRAESMLSIEWLDYMDGAGKTASRTERGKFLRDAVERITTQVAAPLHEKKEATVPKQWTDSLYLNADDMATLAKGGTPKTFTAEFAKRLGIKDKDAARKFITAQAKIFKARNK